MYNPACEVIQKGGLPNATHNSLIYTLKLLYLDVKILVVFEAQTKTKPRHDLSVYNMPGSHNKIVCDAQVTCPVPLNAKSDTGTQTRSINCNRKSTETNEMQSYLCFQQSRVQITNF